MILTILLIVAGLALLIKSSDWLVESAAALAKRLGVPELTIGLTIVAVGTSLPEMVSAVTSSLIGQPQLALGNVIGSNLSNLCWILGLSSLLATIKTKEVELKRDGYIMLSVTTIFMLMGFRGYLDAFSGLILILIFSVYTLFLIQSGAKKKKHYFSEFLDYFFNFKYLTTIKDINEKIFTKRRIRKRDKVVAVRYKESGHLEKKAEVSAKELLIKDILTIVLSMVGVIAGGWLFITNVSYFADMLGITKTFMGMTLVAIGTTLPELFVAISCIKRKYFYLLIGNVLGSSITNILLVMGLSLLFSNYVVVPDTIRFFTLPFLFLIALVSSVFIRTGWKIDRFEGVILIGAYVFVLLFNYFF
ncbi:MAG: calcium/sodium antiporter [Candidatus Nanoarchaeia archaeon]|nr:calcium/sodium antiporter [Candidatus Nanoarchaeia archaeon]